MYKGSIELARINKAMKLRFNIVLSDEVTKQTYNMPKLIHMFEYAGSEYLKMAPNPYLTIDISKSSDDKGDGYNPNSRVNINKFALFDFKLKIKEALDDFRTFQDLFFTQNDKLYVNKQIATKQAKIIPTLGKTIYIRHNVVYDQESIDKEYEGVTFYINDPSNFCNLTYKELQYLYYEIDQVNMNQLTLELYIIYLLERMKNENIIDTLEFDKTITEEKPAEDEKLTYAPPKIEKPNTIPDDI